MTPSKRVLDYIKTIETLVTPARHLDADRPNVITGGYGETDPTLVHEGMIVTDSIAGEWLQHRVNNLSGKIILRVRQGQFDAMFDFAYNLGLERLIKSKFYEFTITNNKLDAVKDLLTYDHSDGIERGGLLGRRCLEAYWYLNS